MDVDGGLVSALVGTVGLSDDKALLVAGMFCKAIQKAEEYVQGVGLCVVCLDGNDAVLCALPEYKEGMDELLRDLLVNMRSSEGDGPLRPEVQDACVDVGAIVVGDLTDNWVNKIELALLVRSVMAITTFSYNKVETAGHACEMMAAAMTLAIPQAAHAWKMNGKPPGLLVLNLTSKFFRIYWLEPTPNPNVVQGIGHA